MKPKHYISEQGSILNGKAVSIILIHSSRPIPLPDEFGGCTSKERNLNAFITKINRQRGFPTDDVDGKEGWDKVCFPKKGTGVNLLHTLQRRFSMNKTKQQLQTPNRTYKSTIFIMIFEDKKNLLEQIGRAHV